jgi:DNA-binding transcriptional regulator YiaG
MAKTLAQVLQAWRDRNHLTQPQAALRLAVNLDSLQNWEQGRTRPIRLVEDLLKERCR